MRKSLSDGDPEYEKNYSLLKWLSHEPSGTCDFEKVKMVYYNNYRGVHARQKIKVCCHHPHHVWLKTACWLSDWLERWYDSVYPWEPDDDTWEGDGAGIMQEDREEEVESSVAEAHVSVDIIAAGEQESPDKYLAFIHLSLSSSIHDVSYSILRGRTILVRRIPVYLVGHRTQGSNPTGL